MICNLFIRKLMIKYSLELKKLLKFLINSIKIKMVIYNFIKIYTKNQIIKKSLYNPTINLNFYYKLYRGNDTQRG